MDMPQKTIIVMNQAETENNGGVESVTEDGFVGTRLIAQDLNQMDRRPNLILFPTNSTAAENTARLLNASGQMGANVIPSNRLVNPEDNTLSLQEIKRAAFQDDDTLRTCQTVLVVGNSGQTSALIKELTGKTGSLDQSGIAVIKCPVDKWRNLEGNSTNTLNEVVNPRDLANEMPSDRPKTAEDLTCC